MLCLFSNVHSASCWIVFLTIHVHAERWKNITLFIWVVLWSGDLPLFRFCGMEAINVLEDIVQSLAIHLWSNGWLPVEKPTHPIMLKHKIAPFGVLSFILHMKKELKKLCWEEETLREKIGLVNWKAFVRLPNKTTFCVFVKISICSPKLPSFEILGVYVYLAITMLWVSSSFLNRF